VIGDVRGLGLMAATEFTSDGKPDQETAKSVQKACLDRNLLLLTCGTFENVIRWIPPLIVSKEQIDEAVSIFEQAITEVENT
jgi:4-aminobutyrate aminotransferase